MEVYYTQFLFQNLDDCYEDNTDYPENDFRQLQTENVWECQKACQDDEKCQFWTLAKSTKKCHLKTAKKIGCRTCPDLISGPKNCDIHPIHEIVEGGGTYTSGPHLIYTLSTNYDFIISDAGTGATKAVSFWKVKNYLNDFCSLGDVASGSYGKPTATALLIKVLKPGSAVHPKDFTRVWTDVGSGGDYDMAIYTMNPPSDQYRCLGSVAMSGYNALPDKSKYCCIAKEYLTTGDLKETWNDGGSGANADGSIWTVISGVDPYAIEGGNFIGKQGHGPPSNEFLLKIDEDKVRDSTTLEKEQTPLELYETNTVNWIWDDKGSGANAAVGIWSAGASEGYIVPAHFAVPHYGKPTLAYILKATPKADFDTFSPPKSYEKIWTDAGSGADKDVAIWRPVCPAGYVALGMVATSGPYPDSPISCIKLKYVTKGSTSNWKRIWSDAGSGADKDVIVFEADTKDTNVLSVRGMGATNGGNPAPPYFLQSKFVTYYHEKPIKKIEISDIKYELPKGKRMEGPQKIFRTKVKNRSYNTEQTGDRTIEYSFTEESTFTFGASVSMGISVTGSGGIPLVGSVETTVSVETSLSFETGTTTSKTFTDSLTASITVPPRSEAEVFVIVKSYKADIPYSAKVKKIYIDNQVGYGTISGVWRGIQVRDAELDYGETKSLDTGKAIGGSGGSGTANPSTSSGGNSGVGTVAGDPNVYVSVYINGKGYTQYYGGSGGGGGAGGGGAGGGGGGGGAGGGGAGGGGGSGGSGEGGAGEGGAGEGGAGEDGAGAGGAGADGGDSGGCRSPDRGDSCAFKPKGGSGGSKSGGNSDGSKSEGDSDGSKSEGDSGGSKSGKDSGGSKSGKDSGGSKGPSDAGGSKSGKKRRKH